MENIHVSLRLRPLNEKELKQNDKVAWEVINQNTIQVINDNIVNQASKNQLQNALSYSKQLSFTYDRCFDEIKTNKQVYESCVQSILKSSLNGVNGTIFMYGQSGSGKTYTMMGYEKKQNSNGAQASLGQQQNPSLSIFNYSSNQVIQNQQRKKSNSQNGHHSLSPLKKGNNGFGNQQQDIDDIDFEKIKYNTPEDNKGILMLALQDFFDTIKRDEDKTYVVKCSYVEIYNDQIYDLLNPINKLNEVIQVGMNQNKEFYIKGVTQESVSTLEEAYDVLKKGETSKHYAQTTMNHHSSRSHSIFKLYVQSISSVLLKSCMPRRSNSCQTQSLTFKNINNQELLSKISEHDSTLISTSELNFIDLAGSEKVSNHSNLEEVLFNSASKNQNSSNNRDYSPQDLIKERVKEGQFINKSLFFLTQVISQIAEGNPLSHIPYRNSPLTKILKSSLGGNSRTMIILCINPAQSQFEQSYSTIRFGLNAKKIENNVRVNIQAKNNEEALQLLILDYEKKIRELEQQRFEEKTKNADLLKKLNELATQNQQIQQRLMNSNRKNIELSLTRTSNINGEGVCQNFSKSNQNSNSKGENKLTSQKNNVSINESSSRNQKWMNEKQIALINDSTVHCDYVGVLFPTKNNVIVSDVCSQVKRNWQELIFDYEGRYAFHQYQVRNKQFASYLQLWDNVNNNIEKVIDHHIKLYENSKQTQNSLKSQEGIIVDLLQKLNEKQKQGFQLNDNYSLQNQSQTQLLNLGTFSLEEILNLEKIIYQQLETIIKEKFRRQLAENMNLNNMSGVSQNEKEKFLKPQNQGNILNKPEQLIMNNFQQIGKPMNQNDQYYSNTTHNKIINKQEDQSTQKNTIFDDIKIFLKQILSLINSNSNQLIQNTIEQEKKFLKQLFYLNIDPKSLGQADIDWNELDFKHLKSIITKSTYSHLNIFNQQSQNESNEFNKKLSYHTPKANKFNDKDEVYKKNSLSFEEDQNNQKKNKSFQQQGYLTSANKQNILFSNANNSAIEDKLQYHQNPIPKDQEEEIQSNFEKLQSQGCFFDGYSTISNLNSNYIPSNTSIQQNVMGSQRMNNLSNQIGNNNTIIHSNEQSISNNNSNSNLSNFISTPLVLNHNQQSPYLQNYASNPIQSTTFQTVQQLQPLANQSKFAGSQQCQNPNISVTLNYENNISKNQLNTLKMNINSKPESLQIPNSFNVQERSKQNIGSEKSVNIENFLPNTQISLNKYNQTKSHSLHEQSSNSQIQQSNSHLSNNISNGMYYLGPSSQQQQNKIDPLLNQTQNNSNESNSLIQKGITKTLTYNQNLYENSNFSQKDSFNQNIHTKKLEKQFDQNKVNQNQIIEKQQEKSFEKQLNTSNQLTFGMNHKRNYSSQNGTNSVFINLDSNQFQNSNIAQNITNGSKIMKNNNAEQLFNDDSSQSLKHNRSGSVQQAKSYQKIIGNISKGGQNLIDYNNKDISNNKNNTISNIQYNSSISQLNSSNSKQTIGSNISQSKQNCQSANITPMKQQIKLNNMISVDIIQLQSNQSASSKPLVQNDLHLNNSENQKNIPLTNAENKVNSYRQQSNSVIQSQNDKIQKQQPLSQQSSLNSSYNTSINSNQISNKSTYSGYSHLNGTKNYIKFDENHIQQIIKKSIQQKSNM